MGIHVVNTIPSRGNLQVVSGKYAGCHLVGINTPQGKKSLSEQSELLMKLNQCRNALLLQKKIDVRQLATLMHMSRPTLYRKLKGLTDLTPNEWINEARMTRAAELLAEGRYRASQVARQLGFASQSSFGKMFLKQFKVTPATFQRIEAGSQQAFIGTPGTIPAP